jgi:hypothetical protein
MNDEKGENENFKFIFLSNYSFNYTDLYKIQKCLTTPSIKGRSLIFYCNKFNSKFYEYVKLFNYHYKNVNFILKLLLKFVFV